MNDIHFKQFFFLRLYILNFLNGSNIYFLYLSDSIILHWPSKVNDDVKSAITTLTNAKSSKFKLKMLTAYTLGTKRSGKKGQSLKTLNRSKHVKLKLN